LQFFPIREGRFKDVVLLLVDERRIQFLTRQFLYVVDLGAQVLGELQRLRQCSVTNT